MVRQSGRRVIAIPSEEGAALTNHGHCPETREDLTVTVPIVVPIVWGSVGKRATAGTRLIISGPSMEIGNHVTVTATTELTRGTIGINGALQNFAKICDAGFPTGAVCVIDTLHASAHTAY